MQVSRIVSLASLLALFILLPLSPAEAGQAYGMTFSCAPAPSNPNERVCYGNLRAARQSPGPTDFMEFQIDGAGYLYVHASYSGVRYDCAFDRSSSASLAPAAMSDPDVYFSIRMNAQDQCLSNSYFTNSSSYKQP